MENQSFVGLDKQQNFYGFPLIKILFNLLFLTFVLILTDCSSNDNEQIVDIEIVLDQNSYILDSTTVITLTVTNKSDDPIYYICTCQIYLEELENDQVIHSWMVHGFEKCLASIPIKFDETDTFEIDFSYFDEPEYFQNAAFNQTVNYRFKLDLFEDSEFHQILHDDNRISNTIVIINE